MRLITLALLLIFSTQSIAQDCTFLPSDTTVCGFKHVFQMTQEEGTFYYECEDDKLLAISTDTDGVAFFMFDQCGEYEVIFESSIDNCLDTFRIEVNDPSSSVTQLNTNIGLGYGDFDCPEGVTADCDADFVSISIPNGPPVEVWEFCTTASCQTTIYNTEAIGDVNGCLVDTIVCTTAMISDSSEDCVETNQDAFIILNSNGDMVDNNTFLEYLAQLQAAAGLDCPPVFDNCFMENDSSCYDTTVMDTTYLHIPVRLGGKWTLANIDSVELFDTTYFTHLGEDYELILDPGVEFYGPGNLNVFLNKIFITASNDTLKYFPYNFELELQWEEEWIIDTLQLIKEIPIDTIGDCTPCGGNFFESFFNVPGIPDFPCGPVSISYPDVCDCEYQFPDYSLQLIDCGHKRWKFDILGGSYTISHSASGYNTIVVGGFNTAEIFFYTEHEIELYATDNFGCEYVIPITFESIIEHIQIDASPDELSCENQEVILTVSDYSNGGGYPLNEFHEPPIWTLADGGTTTGTSIAVTEPGVYSVSYADVYGCEFEAEYNVIYNDEKFIYYESIAMCGNETVEFNGQTITAPGNYTFDIDCNETTELTVEQYDFTETSEFYAVCDGEQVFVHGYVLLEGSHVLEVQNGSPCPDIVYVEVEEIALNVSVSTSQNCEGNGSILITHDTEGATYTINNDGDDIGHYSSNGNSIEIEVTNSGYYAVSVESNGCISIIGVALELMNYNVILEDEIVLTCEENCMTIDPQVINLSGNVSPNDYSISWTGPNGFYASNQSIQVCEGGDYTINLFYGDGCVVSQNISVVEDFEPDVHVIDVDLCYGECYDDGTYVFCQTTQSTIDIDECNILLVDVRIADDIISEEHYTLCEGESIEVDAVMYDQDGYYSAVLTSGTGCDSTHIFTVEVLESGSIYSDNIIDCTHDNAMITYVSQNANETYIWRGEDGAVVSNEVSFMTNKSGSYTLDVEAIGVNNSCSFIEEFELLEHIVIPEIDLEESYILNCESALDLHANIEEGSTWIWTGGPDQIYIENEILSIEEVGTYLLSITNMEGCSATQSIEITQAEPLELDVIASPTCEGMEDGSFEISRLNGGIAPYTILLDDEEIDMSVGQLEAGDYMLQILQSDGCVYEERIIIEAIPDLDEIPVQNLEYCNNNGITITLNLDDMLSYEWLDGFDGAERQIREEGVFEVAISNGCNSVTSTYHVEDTRVDENFVVSNIFSPTGLPSNQIMKISPQVEYEDFKLFVFSRDGSLVYESNDPENGWDGKIGGNNVVIGSYVWMIESNIYNCAGELEKSQDVGTVMVLY